MDEVKQFLDKPMHSTTVRDNLIIHAATVAMSVLIPATLQMMTSMLIRDRD